ncbi:MAG: Fe-S-containing protein [Suilimivivens sp.]
MRTKAFLAILTCALLLSGCQRSEQKTERPSNNIEPTVSGEKIAIEKDLLSSDARFVNYTTNEITIQLIAGIASDDTYRVSLNTCQSCNPSPLAYFTYEDGILTCQNCGNKFTMDDVGIQASGCNPMNVDYIETDEQIMVDTALLEKYSKLFEKWQDSEE